MECKAETGYLTNPVFWTQNKPVLFHLAICMRSIRAVALNYKILYTAEWIPRTLLRNDNGSYIFLLSLRKQKKIPLRRYHEGKRV